MQDRALLERLVDDPAPSGTAFTSAGEFRWGKAVLEPTSTSPGGAFLVAQFTGPARAEVERITRLVAMVCVGGLLLTAGIAFVVAGQILAPVRTVRLAASRMTRADLGQRIEVRGRDDVAALALTYNAMLDRLEQAFRAQQRFASAAERHLRAPLAVLGHSGAGAGERAEASAQAEAVLDDLGVLAASEAPGFLSVEPVDLAVLTDQLAQDVRGLGDRAWVLEQAGEGVAALDGLRVRQAVRRLARNAMQQPTRGAPLRLGVASEGPGGAIEFWVCDDGPGLSPERAASVLDRYVDGTEDSARTASGAGLGLAVVRAVADAHEGSAWVETAPGEGARFGLRLPVVPAPASAAGPVVAPEALQPAGAA